MPDLTSVVAFQNLKAVAIRVVKSNPKGIRQAAVARELGIPAKFDHNWITKSLLDGLVEEGVLQKDENKLFTAA